MTSASGAGPTPLAAFDSALHEAGIGDVNIIALSSIIPAGAVLSAGRPDLSVETWGHRLYAVLVKQCAVVPGHEAWCGIGWVQDKTGRGLFVEHHAESEKQVRNDILASLEHMRTYRGQSFGAPEMLVQGATCIDRPVVSVVAATYHVEPW